MAAFIIYIIRWAVCLTMLYSLFGLFMKRETLHGINRIVLLFVLAASMMLPFVQISTKETNIMTESREMIESQIVSLTPSTAPSQSRTRMRSAEPVEETTGTITATETAAPSPLPLGGTRWGHTHPRCSIPHWSHHPLAALLLADGRIVADDSP